MRFVLLFVALSFALASPASAKWRKVESDHFVIYADKSEDDLREFATQLEQFHSAMAYVRGIDFEKPSPSNRVTIYVAGSYQNVRRLFGDQNAAIGGFYRPIAGFSHAVVPDIRQGRGGISDELNTLLHEYAHHFQFATTRERLPRWLTEGYAEFFAAAEFERDGSMTIGRPNLMRAEEIVNGRYVPVEQLLDIDLYIAESTGMYDSYYGRSWLLLHYLTFSREREGQLMRYWNAVASGEKSLAAAERIFGDIQDLEDDMRAYGNGGRMAAITVLPENLATGTITVRELSEGEADAMWTMMDVRTGVGDDRRPEVLEKARALAARYPDDAGVLTVLAEIEYDSENDAEAIAAASRARQLDPTRAAAYVYEGRARFRQAGEVEGADAQAAYDAALKPFLALNQIEPDHPLPLRYYYRSFVEQGRTPPEAARHALERAAQLAPFDHSLWVEAARMQAMEGKIALARSSLAPAAASAHPTPATKQANFYLDALASAEEGVPFALPNWEPEESEENAG